MKLNILTVTGPREVEKLGDVELLGQRCFFHLTTTNDIALAISEYATGFQVATIPVKYQWIERLRAGESLSDMLAERIAAIVAERGAVNG